MARRSWSTRHRLPALRLLVAGLAVGCSSSAGPATGPAASPTPREGRLVVLVLGGGACTQHSTAPSCLPQPLSGAVVVVTGAGVSARLTTDDRGQAELEVAPGRYRLVAEPVATWPVTAAPQDVTVPSAGATVRLVHSTGFQ